MIRYLFYLVFVVCLVLLQTSILPYLPFVGRFYDFLIPLIVYLSLYKPLGDGLPVLAAGGLIMDMLSGAPIGIYMTTYLWVFIACRGAPRWISIRDHLLFSVLVVLGVLFQNVLFSAAVLMAEAPRFFTPHSLRIILLQLFWALVTAPFLWLGFRYLFVNPGRLSGKESRNGI